MKRILFVALAIILSTQAKAQITAAPITPEEAVELLVEGVDVSNVTFTGSAVQLGLLTGAEGTIFNPSEGIILSCADVGNVTPGTENDVPFGEGVSGDQDLVSVANDVPGLIGQNFSVSSANDIAALEFDFVPCGDSISFNYSFGSDEYLEWVNSSFNDIFAFFLSGPGITGPYNSPVEFPDGAINIAQVPDTDPLLPITVSSVNDQINSQYYIDNVGNIDIGIDGFTVVFTAEAAVQAGETYHIKLAIADGTDSALESIVVLEAGSFSSNAAVSATVEGAPPNFPSLTLLEGCIDGFFTVFRPNADLQDTLFLDISGNATEIDDYLDLPDFIVFPDGELEVDIPVITVDDQIDEGLETVTVTYEYVNACGEADTVIASLNIVDYKNPSLNLPEEIFLCNGENQVVSGVPEDGFAPFTYTWSTGETTPNITVSGDTENPVTIDVVDFCGREAEDGFQVFLPEPFVVIDEVDLCFGLSTITPASGGSTPYTYIYPADSIEIDDNTMTPLFEGDYTIISIDACGEEGVTEIEVDVCETVIPNVFSPNSDGSNDFFRIEGNDGFPGSSLQVYNRWGQLVYESANYQNNFRGDDLAEGTYYIIYTRSDGVEFTGTVTLLRK
ncbi:choice-of-anchor L domain-containing protein [Sanyastnella coralliicola]|uniref:choice-of-anchor L domain-containing protein n=1 Tax=Sanyastnella coralliicola TaxID=3069118 RepID=UPI0027BA04D2|nr:choice-of-anchor L domain-containing protein [Longitalea sp. SCSIO 12813]